jgi:hypothetical protein
MNYRVQYLRDLRNHPVGCVVIKINRHENRVQYQLSVLNPADRFDRKVARQLALGRLTEAPLSTTLPKNANMHTITRAVMEHLKEQNVPSRAVKAAKFWLSLNVSNFDDILLGLNGL